MKTALLLFAVIGLILYSEVALAEQKCVIMNAGATEIITAVPCGPNYNPPSARMDTSDARWTAYLSKNKKQEDLDSYNIKYRAQLARGLSVVSTGTPALNGTYPLDDPASAMLVSSEAFGSSAVAMRDVNGKIHLFDRDHMSAYAAALGTYLGSLAPDVVGPPGNQGWPSNPSVTIP